MDLGRPGERGRESVCVRENEQRNRYSVRVQGISEKRQREWRVSRKRENQWKSDIAI